MKNLNTILQNACEDYLVSLGREIRLTDLEDICSVNLSDLVWNAAREAESRLKNTKQESIINGVKQSDARLFLNAAATTLLNKPVGSYINTIKMLFRDAATYGFQFRYGTLEGWCSSLKHTCDDIAPIMGYELKLLK